MRAPSARRDWSGSVRPAEAIEALGSKTAARGVGQSRRRARRARHDRPAPDPPRKPRRRRPPASGYPMLLKAAAGGGGKGMRVVRRRPRSGERAGMRHGAKRSTRSATTRCMSRSSSTGPRHVEIQILADSHGTVVSLGERECSVQRRHQKIIEEAPSVAVRPSAARADGRDGGPRGRARRGTSTRAPASFSWTATAQFYFLEMNTRIQVEHPVTELVTGIDLVQWQLRIAAGERIPVCAGRRSLPRRVGDRVPDHERGPEQRLPAVDRPQSRICACRPVPACAGMAASSPGRKSDCSTIRCWPS